MLFAPFKTLDLKRTVIGWKSNTIIETIKGVKTFIKRNSASKVKKLGGFENSNKENKENKVKMLIKDKKMTFFVKTGYCIFLKVNLYKETTPSSTIKIIGEKHRNTKSYFIAIKKRTRDAILDKYNGFINISFPFFVSK
ncbi:MAG: hypothetical protein PHY30_01865 [Candidatus Pacebacteria bacterium]|nr:hypothetical protein [Candidatus Paceibacterota bacterium]